MNREIVFVAIIIAALVAWIVYRLFFGRVTDIDIIRKDAMSSIKDMYENDISHLEELYQKDLNDLKTMSNDELRRRIEGASADGADTVNGDQN